MRFRSVLFAVPLVMAASATFAQDGDPAKGEALASRCAACHSFDEGGRNKVGPNLWGVMDRGVAAVEGFSYSSSLDAAAEAVPQWSPERVAAYLADPTGWVREVTGDSSARSRMTFKVKDETQRQDLVAYLATLQ